MRKLAIFVAALVAAAFTVPFVAAPSANAETVKKVIIKKGGDRGRHRGWRHSRGHAKKVVIVKKRGHRHRD